MEGYVSNQPIETFWKNKTPPILPEYGSYSFPGKILLHGIPSDFDDGKHSQIPMRIPAFVGDWSVAQIKSISEHGYVFGYFVFHHEHVGPTIQHCISFIKQHQLLGLTTTIMSSSARRSLAQVGFHAIGFQDWDYCRNSESVIKENGISTTKSGGVTSFRSFLCSPLCFFTPAEVFPTIYDLALSTDDDVPEEIATITAGNDPVGVVFAPRSQEYMHGGVFMYDDNGVTGCRAFYFTTHGFPDDGWLDIMIGNVPMYTPQECEQERERTRLQQEEYMKKRHIEAQELKEAETNEQVMKHIVTELLNETDEDRIVTFISRFRFFNSTENKCLVELVSAMVQILDQQHVDSITGQNSIVAASIIDIIPIHLARVNDMEPLLITDHILSLVNVDLQGKYRPRERACRFLCAWMINYHHHHIVEKRINTSMEMIFKSIMYQIEHPPTDFLIFAMVLICYSNIHWQQQLLSMLLKLFLDPMRRIEVCRGLVNWPYTQQHWVVFGVPFHNEQMKLLCHDVLSHAIHCIKTNELVLADALCDVLRLFCSWNQSSLGSTGSPEWLKYSQNQLTMEYVQAIDDNHDNPWFLARLARIEPYLFLDQNHIMSVNLENTSHSLFISTLLSDQVDDCTRWWVWNRMTKWCRTSKEILNRVKEELASNDTLSVAVQLLLDGEPLQVEKPLEGIGGGRHTTAVKHSYREFWIAQGLANLLIWDNDNTAVSSWRNTIINLFRKTLVYENVLLQNKITTGMTEAALTLSWLVNNNSSQNENLPVIVTIAQQLANSLDVKNEFLAAVNGKDWFKARCCVLIFECIQEKFLDGEYGKEIWDVSCDLIKESLTTSHPHSEEIYRFIDVVSWSICKLDIGKFSSASEAALRDLASQPKKKMVWEEIIVTRALQDLKFRPKQLLTLKKGLLEGAVVVVIGVCGAILNRVTSSGLFQEMVELIMNSEGVLNVIIGVLKMGVDMNRGTNTAAAAATAATVNNEDGFDELVMETRKVGDGIIRSNMMVGNSVNEGLMNEMKELVLNIRLHKLI
jgi:hypothetical protein